MIPFIRHSKKGWVPDIEGGRMREGLTTKGQQVGNLWDVGIVLYLICVFRKLSFKVLMFSFNLFLGGSVPAKISTS